MSTFKTLAIIGIVIAILPSDRENQQRLTQAAIAVTSEARTFCASRPNICITREQAWDAFVAKATFAYELGQELIWGQPANASHFGSGFSHDARITTEKSQAQGDGIGSFLRSSFTTN